MNVQIPTEKELATTDWKHELVAESAKLLTVEDEGCYYCAVCGTAKSQAAQVCVTVAKDHFSICPGCGRVYAISSSRIRWPCQI